MLCFSFIILYNHTIAPLPIFVNYFFKKVFYFCFFFNTRFSYSFLMFFRLPPYFFSYPLFFILMFQWTSVHYIEQFIQKKKACYSAAFSDSRERNTCSSSSPSLCCGRCGSGLSRNGMPASSGSHALFHCTPRSSRRLRFPLLCTSSRVQTRTWRRSMCRTVCPKPRGSFLPK